MGLDEGPTTYRAADFVPKMENKIIEPTMAEFGQYAIMEPDQTFRGMTYSDLIQDWHYWIFSENPDLDTNLDICYLRGDMLGEPMYPEEHNLIPGSWESIEDPRALYDRTGIRGITITDKTALFFPVYASMFVVGDNFKKRELTTTNECRLAAREEFNLVSYYWAVFRGKKDVPLVGKHLSYFYVESAPFELFVSEKNRVHKEPAFNLEGPRVYHAVAVGVFILLIPKPSLAGTTFSLDFGGTTTDYRTRAVYDITVTPSPIELNKDASKEMVKRKYPSKKLLTRLGIDI